MSRILLRALLGQAFLGAGIAQAQLPPIPVPPENPITPAKAVLGKALFWDEQLSSDDTTACATCHIPSAGGGDPHSLTPENLHPGPDAVFGTSDDRRGSRGVVRCAPDARFTPDASFFPRAQVTARKAPSAIGAAWAPELFWDGRAGSTFLDPLNQRVVATQHAALESQAAGPLVSDVEMACEMRSPQDVATKLSYAKPLALADQLTPDLSAALAVDPTYPELFEAAFGDRSITPARIALAIATYERTLVPDQTPYDLGTLTPAQQRGLQAFRGNGACTFCHTEPLFTDHSYSNIGVRPDSDDPGRFAVTQNPADLGAFKVPALRNVGLNTSFFHNGGKRTLAEVVELYRLGGEFPGPNLDVRLSPAFLSPAERADLVEFLRNGLTDPRVAAELPPFDRPRLASERAATRVARYGFGTSGTGDIAPVLVAPHPSFLGNQRFTLGIARALGGSQALLGFATAPAPAGLLLGSQPLWIAPTSWFAGVVLPLAGAPGLGGSGYESLVLPIPADPLLDGQTLYVQGFVVDPQGSDGLAVSGGAAVSLFGI
jgi:cytochrome c peroxidase